MKPKWIGSWKCTCGTKGTVADIGWRVDPTTGKVVHYCPACGARVVLK